MNKQEIYKSIQQRIIIILMIFTIILCILNITTLLLHKEYKTINENSKYFYTKIAEISNNIDDINKNIENLEFQDTIIFNNEKDITDTLDNISIELGSLKYNIEEHNLKLDEIVTELDNITKSINSLKSAQTSMSNYISSTNSVFSVDGKITTEFYNKVLNNYNKIPEHIRQSFSNNGWRIYITSGKIPYTYSIKALTSYTDKIIYLSTKDSASILHEMGHYVDYINGRPSYKIPKDIYYNEVENLKKVHLTHENNYNTAIEYFAECFYLYFLDNDLLKKNCPQTYAYIEEYL